MREFKLAAIDCDGTLVDHRDRVRPRVCEAVKATQAAGVEVVLCTGRSQPGALHAADQIGVDVAGILVHGALLTDSLREPPYERRMVPVELAWDAIQRIEASGLAVYIYDDPTRTGNVAVRCGVERLPGFVDGLNEQVEWVDSVESWLAAPVLTVVAGGSTSEITALRDVLRAVHGEALTIDVGWYPPDQMEMLIITAAGCNKWAAVQRHAAHRGFSTDQVLAIGDGHNDLELLRGVGWGVAMGSASEAVQAAADEVVPDAENDGVAVALERHILCARGESR